MHGTIGRIRGRVQEREVESAGDGATGGNRPRGHWLVPWILLGLLVCAARFAVAAGP
ncbi:MAG: hypothetical protein K2Y51_02750 [Gammaproteobacteria bacterium]|nr:hypothetical protein [Gammaproteobacteria bacterium]